MESHFTWFDMLHIPHEYTYVAASAFVTLLVVLLSVTANFALGRGEAAVQPAAGFGIKGLFEATIEFINNLVKSVMGQKGRYLVPSFAAIFFYILLSNLVGLIPGLTASTSNINAALSIGVFSFIYYNYQGFKHAGPGYLKHFMGPMPIVAVIVLPIEIVSNLVRPLSLGIRLSVNMQADHAILGTFTNLTKLFVPVIFYGMGTFVSFIQAFVFTILSIVYVMMATVDDHH